MDEIINFVKKIGVGVRQPNDNFLKEGNKVCQPLTMVGIYDYDNEAFYHKPYKLFYCHAPGCEKTFDTVIQYESHYNSCHTHTCPECNKNLPNYHLLDLHISETHDSFFAELAKRKPMFKCFIKECNEVFNNSQERRDHGIKGHQLPSDFRFDSHKKQKKNKVVKVETKIEKEDENAMHVDEETTREHKEKNKANKNKKLKEFSFGHVQGRKKVFETFSKDILESLPK